jgi:hypothetical protein
VVRMATENRDWGYRRKQGALANAARRDRWNRGPNKWIMDGKVARNLSDDVEGFLMGKRYLIHDRDPLYTAEFLGTLGSAGVKSVKLPPRSPNLATRHEIRPRATSSRTGRALVYCVLRRGKGLRSFPRTPFSARRALPPLRSG